MAEERVTCGEGPKGEHAVVCNIFCCLMRALAALGISLVTESWEDTAGARVAGFVVLLATLAGY